MLSIIIPTLNEEKTIENTIKSLKKLSDYEYEIIISDGKSTDKTVEIAKKYGAKVMVYKGVVRQTIGGGRNFGAFIASGDFLVFLDADVTIPDMNNFFKKALLNFEGNPRLVGITSKVKVLPEFEKFSDRINFGFINSIHRLANNILHIGMAMGEFQMLKRKTFEALGGFNEKIVVAEDQEFFRRLSRFGITRLPKNLTVYHTGRRIHKLGWIRMWIQWMTNGLFVAFFNKSLSKEWKVIR